MRRRNRKKSKRMDYGNLEPRVMLAGDLDAARNLVVDGNFEDADSTAFFAFADEDASNTQDIEIRELSTSFSRVVQVDSVAGQIDSLAQDVETQDDNEYIISFDLRGRNLRPGDAADTNDVEVFFADRSLGVFRGVSQWQTITVSASTVTDLTRLEFREVSADSDGRGVFVDNVAIAGVRGIEIVNQSFEDIDDDISSGVVRASAVPGFSAISATGEGQIGILATDATDGNNVLNLNSSDSNLDRVFQNVETEAGGLYYVTFDLRNGDQTDTDEVNLRLRWGGQFGGSFNATTEWQRVGSVLGADSSSTTLLFRERGSNTGDGLDVQIDNIQIFKIDAIEADYVLDLNGANDGDDIQRSFTENGETVIAADDLQVAYSNGEILQSATARVLDFTGSELLSAVTEGTNIEANFNTSNGILRLVGRDTAENYQQVLRTLTFTDRSDNPEEITREITVTITDGSVASARRTAFVPVTAVNDAPVIEEINDVSLPEDFPLTFRVDASDPDNNDDDLIYDIAVSGQSFIFGDEQPTISEDGEVSFETATHGDATITVTVEDPNGAVSERSFDVSVAFVAPTGDVPDDFVPFSGQRQLSDTLPSERNGIYDVAPTQNIDLSLDYQAIIETPDGDIVFDLFENESPITVNNFVNLAEDGFYDGLTFHRVIDNFVAQGGDPTGIGSGGPGYQFVDELDNGLSFEGVGQLAKANSGPDTNGSQFFFTLNENPSFAGQHTIFGQITEGFDVLNAINITGGSADATVIERVRIVTV